MRGAERKGQAFYYFVFQIENLLLAIYDTQVSSQAHSVLHGWGKTLKGHVARPDRKEEQVNNLWLLCGVLACARG